MFLGWEEVRLLELKYFEQINNKYWIRVIFNNYVFHERALDMSWL